VWHIPEVGSSPRFEYEVSNPVEAWLLLDVLAKYDQFQLDKLFSEVLAKYNQLQLDNAYFTYPDYAPAQGLYKLNEDDLLWEEYNAAEELNAEEEDITKIELEELRELYEYRDNNCLRPRLRREMLEDFRELSELTDQEMIEKAESNTLPKEGYFKVWLILLNRKDLADKL
jgi:hypothetical protein